MNPQASSQPSSAQNAPRRPSPWEGGVPRALRGLAPSLPSLPRLLPSPLHHPSPATLASPSHLKPGNVLPLQSLCVCWALCPQLERPAHPVLPSSFPVLTLIVLWLRKPLRPGQNRWWHPTRNTHVLITCSLPFFGPLLKDHPTVRPSSRVTLL